MKEKNPQLKNTEISRILGELWRNTGDDEKEPFVLQEEVEREKYKENMAVWRKKKAIDDEIKKQERAEKTKQVMAAMEKAEQEKKESHSMVKNEDLTFKQMTSPQGKQRHEESNPAPPLPYHRYSPLQHPGQQHYVDHSHYVQHQGSWPAHEAHSQQYHNPSTQYRSAHYNQHMNNGPEKYGSSYDVFHNQQDLAFPETNSFYDQSHQRPMKLDDRIDSPYSYSADEFDPVPIHG